MRTDARQVFLEECGPTATANRQRAIEQLPIVVWKGQDLRRILCRADFGCGPHYVNVPESILWSLLSLERFVCAWHR